MQTGLISDSHDHLENLERALEVFRSRGVRRIWHAGDIVSPPMLLAMQGFEVTAVFGNNDGEKIGLHKAALKIGGRLDGDFLELEAPCGQGSIALYHGTYAPFLYSMIHSGKYRTVISGHTHKPVNRMEGETLVLNPGTSHGFRQRASVMIYDDATHTAELIDW
ncbi:MAG: YfcE family phosphodiesterase [Magnetococcales bacterium]|nr:YfcE family phosphodiesterase [Magnetococcales bacterium]